MCVFHQNMNTFKLFETENLSWPHKHTSSIATIHTCFSQNIKKIKNKTKTHKKTTEKKYHAPSLAPVKMNTKQIIHEGFQRTSMKQKKKEQSL